MHVMNDRDFKTFEQFVRMPQATLKKVMARWLRDKYEQVVETEDYIYAIGTIPVALAAHMDTVFSTPVEDLFYDTRKNVMWSPEGLGADDRAGVFAIYQIVKAGFRPHIILSTDEERGCLGARKLSKESCPFEDLKYIMQLDRHGVNDCVFYECDNPEFVSYIEQFGFVEAIGSFTDITEYCPAWGVAGVNLSVGYVDEHTHTELLYVNALYTTIEKVKKMLKEETIPFFKYIPCVYGYHNYPYWGYNDGYSSSAWGGISGTTMAEGAYDIIKCPRCGRSNYREDTFPVIGLDGTQKYFCTDCLTDKDINWCSKCYQAVEKDPKEPSKGKKFICPTCLAKKAGV